MKKKEWNRLTDNHSPVEAIKDRSDYLRGSILESLADESTASIAESDQQLIKFHGMYQQDDRDRRVERQKKKLEPWYSFMIRIRIPGGFLTADQWLKMDKISDTYANGTLKLTTRQALQFHGVIKFDLQKTIQAMDKAALDSIAACGDVNRNVMCTANPALMDKDREVLKTADEISLQMLPKTKAYHEIWLNSPGKEKQEVSSSKEEIEPLYGKHYLPRKFKIAIAVPPHNDTDIYSNDIGLIAVLDEDRKLTGFNVTVGGGLGSTFGMPETFPRLGDLAGYCPKEKITDAVYHIIGIQRDYGNRSNRKLSRFKYTMENMGLEKFHGEFEERAGFKLSPVRKFLFDRNADLYEWQKDENGTWILPVFVEGGRVADHGERKLKSGLAELAKKNLCNFILTGNQNLILSDIDPGKKSEVSSILKKYGIPDSASNLSGLRKNSIACVALNTCPLAMAEAERYLPDLIDQIDPILKKHKLTEEEINIRMTGCPNGCGRPFLGEVAFIGRSLGHYNMYLGASFNGDRLNKLYKENLTEEKILNELDILLGDFSKNKKPKEHFGDFCIRQKYIKKTTAGANFHD